MTPKAQSTTSKGQTPKRQSTTYAVTKALGDGDTAVLYNPQTGRPIRQSAGRRSLTAGFVSSNIANSDVSESEESEESESEDDSTPPPKSKKRKRMALPDLALPSRSPSPLLDGSTEDNEFDSVTSLDSIHKPTQSMALTLNIPPGHTGPLILSLDIGTRVPQPSKVVGAETLPVAEEVIVYIAERYQSLRQQGRPDDDPELMTLRNVLATYERQQGSSQRRQKRQQTMLGQSGMVRYATKRTTSSRSRSGSAHPAHAPKANFLDLPAELRNEVYRMVFVDAKPIDFCTVNNFAHSAALLRTCRQVHTEGCSILYGENDFYLRRRYDRRTPRWIASGSEIGFIDVHHFLKSITPSNISRLRNVTLLLEDATPSLNPLMRTAEERRFVNDLYVMSSLRFLADHGQIRILKISLRGRKYVTETDHHFISRLGAVKADTVIIGHHPDFVGHESLHRHYASKIHWDVASDLIGVMTRKHKLYERSETRGTSDKKGKSSNPYFSLRT